MNKEIMINQQDLIDWIDRSPSNDDLDLINYIVNRLDNFYTLEERNKNALNKAQEVKDHIDKSKFDGMTKSILLMAINEIIYSLNGKENTH